MVKFEGKSGVSATVVCDSISEAGIRLLTFELTYWRGVLSEANTHRMLSKNSASSRAIPFAKMKENLTGRPVRFGAANPGMQDKGEDFNGTVMGWPQEHEGNCGAPAWSAEEAWNEAREHAVFFSEAFYKAGYAKQVYNRLTEPFQMMKTVLSGTELENFFWLRDDGAADPSLAELARCMREAKDTSTPKLLKAGEYHLPYVEYEVDPVKGMIYYITDNEGFVEVLTVENAVKVSCARAAAVSFRNTDYGLDKCLEVYERLVGDERKHASALEHQATPMAAAKTTYQSLLDGSCWKQGVSHMDSKGFLWSGNFRGFVQHRKLVDGENKSGY